MRNKHKLNIFDLREDKINKQSIYKSSKTSERIEKARHIDKHNIVAIYRGTNNIRNLCFWVSLRIPYPNISQLVLFLHNLIHNYTKIIPLTHKHTIFHRMH